MRKPKDWEKAISESNKKWITPVESKQEKKDKKEKLDMVIKTLYDDISGFTRSWVDTSIPVPIQKKVMITRDYKTHKSHKPKMIPKKSGRMLRFEKET
jgi:hypothetical protein